MDANWLRTFLPSQLLFANLEAFHRQKITPIVMFCFYNGLQQSCKGMSLGLSEQ